MSTSMGRFISLPSILMKPFMPSARSRSRLALERPITRYLRPSTPVALAIIKVISSKRDFVVGERPAGLARPDALKQPVKTEADRIGPVDGLAAEIAPELAALFAAAVLVVLLVEMPQMLHFGDGGPPRLVAGAAVSAALEVDVVVVVIAFLILVVWRGE